MPKKLINDYIFYKIVCLDNSVELCYVGSTANWKERQRQHKNNCNNENGKLYNTKIYKTIREYGGWSNFKMIQLGTREQLNKREAEQIEEEYRINLKASLNTIRCYITGEQKKELRKEYIENNKEKIKEQRKEYYENNKEEKIKYAKNYRENNKEQVKEYRENNKEKMKEYNKNYRENNKEYDKEYSKNNKEQIKKVKKIYSENNKEKMKEYQKEYRDNNKEKMKEYQKEYRDNNKIKILANKINDLI